MLDRPTDLPAESTRAHPRRRPGCPLGALLVTLLLAALAGAPGCMVADELDSAAAKMPTTGKAAEQKKRDPSGESLGAAGRLAAAKAATQARSKQWWGTAKSIAPGEKPAGVVQCRMPEGVKFMTRDDCLSQGGRPVGGSS